jgi:hypothetical protein
MNRSRVQQKLVQQKLLNRSSKRRTPNPAPRILQIPRGIAMTHRNGWALLVAANALCLGVLSFYQTGNAQQSTGGQPPFANSTEQRMETITELREIKALLKEQNALLSSGNLKVIITLPQKPK